MGDPSSDTTSTSTDDDYIRTASGNFVSRHATLQGAHQVELKGRSWFETGVTLRGDLAPIRVGRYNAIGTATSIVPPPLLPSNDGNAAASENAHVPVSIGAHTTIGTHCDIQAAAIGSYNCIGNHVTLGPRVILKDAVVVVDGTKIPADTVIPPFTRVSPGTPLELISLSPATIPILQDAALDNYHERVRVASLGA